MKNGTNIVCAHNISLDCDYFKFTSTVMPGGYAVINKVKLHRFEYHNTYITSNNAYCELSQNKYLYNLLTQSSINGINTCVDDMYSNNNLAFLSYNASSTCMKLTTMRYHTGLYNEYENTDNFNIDNIDNIDNTDVFIAHYIIKGKITITTANTGEFWLRINEMNYDNSFTIATTSSSKNNYKEYVIEMNVFICFDLMPQKIEVISNTNNYKSDFSNLHVIIL